MYMEYRKRECLWQWVFAKWTASNRMGVDVFVKEFLVCSTEVKVPILFANPTHEYSSWGL